MSQPGRRMYSMHARSDKGFKGELAQSQHRVPDLNQAQRNFQFRSRAKTNKEGNNGLDKKDWILKKIFRQFLHWMRTRDVFNIQLYRKVQRSNQLYSAGWRVESIRFEDQIFFYIYESQTKVQKSSSC